MQMKKYTVIWKYYNDMWVIKYECRTSDNVDEAMINYREYEDKWKYISIRVEINWKRAWYRELQDIKIEEVKAYQKSKVKYHSKEEIIKAIRELTFSIQDQRDECKNEKESKLWNHAMNLISEAEWNIQQVNPDEMTKFIMKH